MQTFALLGMAAMAVAQSVVQPTANVSPTASAPAGCSTSFSGAFELMAVNMSSVGKRDLGLQKRATVCGGAGTLVVKTLNNGQLNDAQGRLGEIVANNQFQFDVIQQTGTLFTSGFSVCNNGSLALGGSAVFFQCLSGGFFNLYDKSTGAQCSPILLQTIPCTISGSADPPSGGVGQSADGQPTGTSVGVVSQKTDGQPTGGAGATGVVSQQTDGQPTAASAKPLPITQISDGQVQASGAVPLSQISDGQIQVVTAMPISQISDGQIQRPTGVVSQISDGQIQKPTGVVSQISDGQIQKPTGVVSQISDGQIQATTAAPKTTATGVISQISDGQPQATRASNATSSQVQVTSSGNNIVLGSQLAAIIAGVVAVAFL